MNSLVLSVLLSVAQQGIYGGFNLQWVPAYGGLGKVALSVGSANVNGNIAVNAPNHGHLSGSFPYDSVEITPWVPDSVTVGLNWVAYCYVVMIGNLQGNAWFQNGGGINWDFVCEASNPTTGVRMDPTDTGNPHSPIPYPPANPTTNIATANAIFVGSVMGSNVANGALNGGNPAGFSVNPFFRNGSQVVLSTNKPCPNCGGGNVQNPMNPVNWDVGFPTSLTGRVAPVGPTVQTYDFTTDGPNSAVPLSATELIFEGEAHPHNGDVASLCFMDPNWNTLANPVQARSCQSEILTDSTTTLASNWFDCTPFRTQVSVGLSTTANTPYGAVFMGVACTPNSGMQIYVDTSYRGYVEPERQLMAQVARGVGSPCGGSNPNCLPGLDCVNNACLIPPHSSNFQCNGNGDCEKTSQGGAVTCQEKICCNSLSGPCAAENDCCTGFLCVNGSCLLETDHGFCNGVAGDCASNDCVADFCACLPAGAMANNYLYCCSGQLNGAQTACAASTLKANCTPGTVCSPNTEACFNSKCCITSIGSKTEPCNAPGDCCQNGAFTMGCNANTCCNIVNGPCATDDDCCVSNICSIPLGQSTGLCKINSGTGFCHANSDCVSGSCNLTTTVCN